MDKRISLVTLGCRDVLAACRFYQALGWSDPKVYEDHTVFWQAGGMVLGLWARDQMVDGVGAGDAGDGFEAMMLAYNVGSREEVDAILADAERAGGRITSPAKEHVWGGYSGVFTDPEGHAWEIAHNPGWTLNDDGTISLN
jgi:uncharacterized protein